MQLSRSKFWCFTGRTNCLIIGYVHLLSSLLEIGCHLLVVAIVTSGFQCDVDVTNLRTVDWPWIQSILLILNLGTHGFFPFPVIFSSLNSAYVQYMQTSSQPKCYPGMIHLYFVDVLTFLINAIWLRLVVSFIASVHKKDPQQMRLFFNLSTVKLVMEIMYLAFRPGYHDNGFETFWFMEILDICIAVIILMTIHNYIKSLSVQKLPPIPDQPPAYVECLIIDPKNQTKDTKTEAAIVQSIEDKKKLDSPAILPI